SSLKLTLNFSIFVVALLPFLTFCHLIKQGLNTSPRLRTWSARLQAEALCCILAAPARRSCPANRADSHVARRIYASPPFCVDSCRVGLDCDNFVFRPDCAARPGAAHCPHSPAPANRNSQSATEWRPLYAFARAL